MVNAVWVSVPHGGEGMVVGTVYFCGCRSKRLLVHTSEDQTELGQEVESMYKSQGLPPQRAISSS